MMRVEAEEGNVVCVRMFLDFQQQLGEDPFVSPFFLDEHALDPPDRFVAPVAPFHGDHELPDDNPIFLCNKVHPLRGISEEFAHTSADCPGIKRYVLAFLC